MVQTRSLLSGVPVSGTYSQVPSLFCLMSQGRMVTSSPDYMPVAA